MVGPGGVSRETPPVPFESRFSWNDPKHQELKTRHQQAICISLAMTLVSREMDEKLTPTAPGAHIAKEGHVSLIDVFHVKQDMGIEYRFT